jgi:hypothetical protein
MRTYYVLAKEVPYTPSPAKGHISVDPGPITFPPGTIIQPIWNPRYLPAHLQEDLEFYNRNAYSEHANKYIMCSVGPFWIPIPESYIRAITQW